jgi:hypothetical protein
LTVHRLEREDRPIPAHPYRDSALVYGIMGVLLVVVAGLTGGSIVRAAVAALLFFTLATAWSWWRFRKRIGARGAASAAVAAAEHGESGSGDGDASVSAGDPGGEHGGSER